MPHLVRWNEELGEFGLVVVGAHVQRAEPDEVRAKSRSLGVNFAIVGSGSVQGASFKGIPHCMLFDHTGKCLYRGSPAPSSIEAKLRAAVGSALVEGTGKASFGKTMAPLADALRKGQSPMTVLQRALPYLRSSDAATVEEAKLLVGKLTEEAQRQVDQAAQLRKDEPVAAYERLYRVALNFKGTAPAVKAGEVLGELKNDKTVATELRARPSLDALKKLDAALSAQSGKTKLDPKGADFQRAFAAPLGQMRATLQQMKKNWPDAKATQDAAEIAEKYGVVIK